MKRLWLAVPVLILLCAYVLVLRRPGSGNDSAALAAPIAAPIGTAFVYQGQLRQSGSPINGTCDLTFGLFDVASGGFPLTTLPVNAVPLSNGLFNVTLDFAGGAFNGEARWLEVSTRCPAGSGGFTTLVPRDPVNAVPEVMDAVRMTGTQSASGIKTFTDGVVGGPTMGTAVSGMSLAAGTGVYGSSFSGTGVYGQSAIGNAGQFQGSVGITGNLTVTTGNLMVTGTKSAIVPGPDGTYRKLYAVEAPENWFEDFGKAQLVNGRATVQIEPEFALTVLTTDYHVFLTPYGDSRGLYVTNQTSTGFEVREQGGGTSSVSFSYRIVAKRKDVAPPRFEHVSLPPAPAVPAPAR